MLASIFFFALAAQRDAACGLGTRPHSNKPCALLNHLIVSYIVLDLQIVAALLVFSTFRGSGILHVAGLSILGKVWDNF